MKTKKDNAQKLAQGKVPARKKTQSLFMKMLLSQTVRELKQLCLLYNCTKGTRKSEIVKNIHVCMEEAKYPVSHLEATIVVATLCQFILECKGGKKPNITS